MTAAYEYYYLKKILNLTDHSYTMVLYQLSLYREEPILYSIYRVTPQPHINRQESQSSIPEDYLFHYVFHDLFTQQPPLRGARL